VGQLGGGPWWEAPTRLNEMPTLQPIKVFFWQTGWFQITLLTICAVVMVFSFWLMAQLTLHKKERLLLQRERARIAMDIHDDLGSRMTQLVLHGEVAQSELPAESAMRSHLGRICQDARDVLSTLDEILWAVNPRRDTLTDFSAYVCGYAQEFLKPTAIQCLFDVDWGELDYLIVDLPPGTGDVHLTLVQSVPVTGAVIVSTPQDVGLQISMKTLRMFQQTKVPILGIVENMSTYVCPHCGARDDIFGHGGAARAAESLGIPFLGEIPLDAAIRKNSDSGTPVVLAEPGSPSAAALSEITGKLAQQISIQAFRSIPLTIIEE
jgi:hypothetical protein